MAQVDRNIAARKLGEIVSAGKASAEKGILALQAEWGIRKDMMVRPGAVDFQITQALDGSKGSVEVGGQSYDVAPSVVRPVIDGTAYSLTGHSRGQLLARAGIPVRFADDLEGWGQHALLVHNLKTLLSRQDSALLVREVSGTVKGVLSSSYKRMDASPIFEEFATSAISKLHLAPYKGEVTDTRAFLSFIEPEIREIAPGEYVVLGTELRASDYGNGPVEVSLVVLRLVCNNGMIGMSMLRKVHIGRRFDAETFQGGGVVTLSDRTTNLDVATLRSGVRDIVTSLPKAFNALTSAVKNRVADAKVDLDATLAALSKSGLGKDTIAKVKATYEQTALPVEALPQAPGAWRLSNVLSLIAQDEKNLDKAHDLREAAWMTIMGKADLPVAA